MRSRRPIVPATLVRWRRGTSTSRTRSGVGSRRASAVCCGRPTRANETGTETGGLQRGSCRRDGHARPERLPYRERPTGLSCGPTRHCGRSPTPAHGSIEADGRSARPREHAERTSGRCRHSSNLQMPRQPSARPRYDPNLTPACVGASKRPRSGGMVLNLASRSGGTSQRCLQAGG